MSKITERASGQITKSDAITIVLVEPESMPSSVIIHWPTQSTVVQPWRYRDVAAAAMKVLAKATTVLAGIKLDREL
jgi:hypothetical protein